MPLHGKIVVLKRSGGDGTEFPLTASCMFGRKPDCDIRIQLPQVSKEHCRIDLNENKEVILTNLSVVNPTCVNGQALQQSERLKHGDVITIIDRSFRFEYPPAPTPKKRSSVGGKAEAIATDPPLKDGANIDNIQRSLEKTQESEAKEAVSPSENKAVSPFSDLYQMIKQSLDVKTPRKSSVSVLETPSSKFSTPKLDSARKNNSKPSLSMSDNKQTSVASESVDATEGSLCVTPKSAKKRRSLQVTAEQTTANAEATSPRRSATPQKFTVNEVAEQISTQTPSRRRSKETTSPVSAKKKVASPAKTETARKSTPKSSEKVKEKPKKRKSEELAADLPTQMIKKKRVSFGGQLSPELFDKRMPPDSPLRKGATPRRSLSLYKPKQSLLRRASVIGLLKECDQEKHLVKSPAKTRTPSPKKSPGAKSASPKTPTSAKKLTKSPKAQSPAKSPKGHSPKSKTPSPKTPSPGKMVVTAKKASPKTPSPKSVKTTPAKSPVQGKPVTPKQQRNSPAPVNAPQPSGDQTPTVKGRFSVSRISTPSPVAVDAVTEPVLSAMVTPKIPLRRKSMKSSAKKTPALKSATKVMCRKSGMMRASMKMMTSWADIVRFGKAKVQVAVPKKKQVTKKTTKKAVPKPQTPKQKLVDHVSTGHAASPATIVVGRAHRMRITHATGGPPKIITNTAVLRKNMKMDDDLTGISEMFKTPINEKKRRSVKKLENSAAETPLADVSKSMMEPSVLNTPEETGEMVVSPMSVASTVKGRRYNSEAVQRLLCGEEESSLVSDIPPLDIQSEFTEPQSTGIKAESTKTPQQKILMPECLTGVKRMMKMPKKKSEPLEDLRGKLLKTPKQRVEQQECLSAVKRIMKTPKEKASPVEDLRGKLMKTPKQKISQQEISLTGVKRMMKTPKEKAVPVEDLRGKLLKTPKQKTVQQEECLSGIKMIMKTPDQNCNQPESVAAVKRNLKSPAQKNEPAEDLRGKLLKTPELKLEQLECLTGVNRIMNTPKEKSEPLEDPRGKPLQTPKQKIEQPECLTGVKRIMTTPKQKNAPVEDMIGVKRLLKTPKEKAQPVEKNFGIKRLMRSPRLRGNAPIEDFEGLEELMKEPLEDEMHASTEETVDEPLESRETVVEEKKQEEDHSEESIEAPVRGHRGRKVETPAALPNRQTTRGRNTKTTKKTESAQEESAPQPTVKPRRGRAAKKALQEQTEEVQAGSTETTSVPEPEIVLSLPPAAGNEAEIVKPRRGGRAKAAERSDVSSSSEAIQPAETEESKEPTVDANQDDGPCVSIVDSAEPSHPKEQKKLSRGRKAKVETKEVETMDIHAEDNQDKVSEEAVPTRGRRGKKTDISKAPAVRQTRGRAGKASEEVTETVPEVTKPLSEMASNQTGDENSVSKHTEQEKSKTRGKSKSSLELLQLEPETTAESNEQPLKDAQPTEKPKRGRKARAQAEPQPEPEIPSVESQQSVKKDGEPELPLPAEKTKRTRRVKTQVEPEAESSAVENELPVEEPQVEQPTATEKPKRGRKTKTAEDSHVTEVPKASGKAKQGLVAKQENPMSEQLPVEFKSPEPKRMRRTKKTEQENPSEGHITDAAEEKPVIEQACPAPKTRRGVQKTTEAESVVSEETGKEVSSSIDKPKRGRKGLQAPEQVSEDDSAKAKPTRGRGKTVKHEVSDATPAKRARRGTAFSTEEVSEPATVEPVKRGRRAAAETTVCAEETLSKDQDDSKLNEAVGDTKTTKRNVKWKDALEVFEIPNVSPVKAVRGRKAKSAHHTEAEGNSEPQKATNPEETVISGKAQPVRRARRGAKAADVAEESTNVDSTETETQPKTRRGRQAKK